MYISEELMKQADELSKPKTHWLNRSHLLRYTSEHREELSKLLDTKGLENENNEDIF